MANQDPRIHTYVETPEMERILDEAEVFRMIKSAQDGMISPQAALQEAKYLGLQDNPVAKELKLFETLEDLCRKSSRGM